MNAITLLLGLLVLAYVGSILVGGRAIVGYGLPSGSEYVLLGFVIGPHVLGVLDGETIREFEPVVQVALGWLGLVVGSSYGFVGNRRVPLARLIFGVLVTLVAAGFVGAAVALTAVFAIGLSPGDGWLLALGVGAVSCETTRHAVRWVALRHAAEGPLADLVADIADADDVVPIVLIAVLFSLAPGAAPSPAGLSIWFGTIGPILVGLLLGALVAGLIRKELRPTQTWGLLLGSTLLAVGSVARLELSPLTATFMMGFALASLSRHGADLRDALLGTERATMLPLLMLAGAHMDLRLSWWVGLLVAVALVTRTLAKLATGPVLLWPKRFRHVKGSSALGLGLLPTGALTMGVGLACALRLGETLGMVVLAAASANVLFGELAGPASLKRALRRAGEIAEPTPLPSPAPRHEGHHQARQEVPP